MLTINAALVFRTRGLLVPFTIVDAMNDERTIAELLAPAGDLACLDAAVHQGADAVYFGLDRGYNARARATNLCIDTLPEIMARLHSNRVKGYVTLNTLVFSPELSDFESVLGRVYEAGVDAVLVQDLGVAKLLKSICPELSLHASTQMTLTSAECIAAIEHLGIERVVLPRELSVDEISHISAATDVELECFVHGALCVAYSGQCLTSESLGGRSANRGQCAQACRLPYDLYCDGEHVDLERVKYLLSPQDLAAFPLLPQLLEAGIRSFKIEGRLKTPEYVAAVTRHYRQTLDAAIAGREMIHRDADVEELQMTFSRGFSPGWLEGCDHKQLVPGESSAKRGVCIGLVHSVRGSTVVVELTGGLSAGDGVMFDAGLPQNQQPGGRVFQLWQGGERVEGRIENGVADLLFRPNTFDLHDVAPGQAIWKTDDPRITRRLRQRLSGDSQSKKWPLTLSVTARVGETLTVTVSRSDGTAFSLQSDAALEAARKHPISQQVLSEQFGRLGNTRYSLESLTLHEQGGPMVPLSVLGALRKQMVARLDEAGDPRPDMNPAGPRVASRANGLDTVRRDLRLQATSASEVEAPHVLHIHCRSLAQLSALLECLGETSDDEIAISIDFADIRQYATAVPLVHRHQRKVMIATPRIQKPTEMGVFRALAKHNADGFLARNLAAIRFFRELGSAVVADYSLNVANELAAGVIKELGVEWLTPSYDLNRDQLLELVDAVPAHWLEMVVHQHMPMFHMEHCVYCAVLSPGTNKTNCGRPCDDHDVQLEDRVGKKHRLTADVGCRNTLFNATPQSAAEVVPALIKRGVRRFRIELLDQQSVEEVRRTVTAYRQLLTGRTLPTDVLATLKAINRVGVTRGTLEAARDPLAIL